MILYINIFFFLWLVGVFLMVFLSSNIKRFSVSCMQDFCISIWPNESCFLLMTCYWPGPDTLHQESLDLPGHAWQHGYMGWGLGRYDLTYFVQIYVRHRPPGSSMHYPPSHRNWVRWLTGTLVHEYMGVCVRLWSLTEQPSVKILCEGYRQQANVWRT